MFPRKLANHQISRLITGSYRNLYQIRVIPKRLCFVEIESMLYLVAVAFLGIEFKLHSIIFIPLTYLLSTHVIVSETLQKQITPDISHGTTSSAPPRAMQHPARPASSRA